MLEYAVVAAAPILIAGYAYVLYPAVLWILALRRPPRAERAVQNSWPSVTITVPVYNAAESIRATLKRLLELDYPSHLLQLLVLSDASTDGTDAIVGEFASRGVELLRSPERLGKTAGENAAVARARGDIIVNVDATVAIPRESLKILISAFSDPTVGVASGRDVSVDPHGATGTAAESRYTGYEMWVRALETRIGSIVGASGCFFAIRRGVHADPLPPELSWDFASTLVARKQGLRSVSIDDAICIVPKTREVRTELRRKARTMARGLNTLFYFRDLMNPFRYGAFALMLISHKLLRWLPYLLAPVAVLALTAIARESSIAAAVLFVTVGGMVTGVLGISKGRHPGKILALAAFVVAALTAGFLAWVDALRGKRLATWNPTPRPNVVAI